MGTEIRVWAYDDLDARQTGRKATEATHVRVALGFEGRRVLIDLGEKNYDALKQFLRRYLDAGTPEGKVNPPSDRRGRKPHAFYAGMRRFAEQRGIDIPTDGQGKAMYDKVPGLRAEWEAELARQASEQQREAAS